MDKNVIKVINAKEHNLKSISVNIPKDKLVVITGPSGSGKSTLAMDTLYAEGQRRYVESLSSYARQFLGIAKRPDVERIEGLCPAIAIEQKTVGYNPRSTVGTITEIYDYLRVLFSRVGIPHCPSCDKPIQAESPQKITMVLLKKFVNKVITIAAPVAVQKKGEYTNDLIKYFNDGYYRFLIDGNTYRFENQPDIFKVKLTKTYKHDVSVLVDRIEVKADDTARLQEAIEKAFALNGGICGVMDDAGNIDMYSSKRICLSCVRSFPEIEPRIFSFNSPIGACKQCHGLGFSYETDYSTTSLNDDLTNSSSYFTFGEKEKVCEYCQGKRLNDEALAVKIADKNIYDFCLISISDLRNFIENIELGEELSEIAAPLFREIKNRLDFLNNVGLSYLNLGRSARTLSGGEGQRIRLATQLGSSLSGVLYILDEPSIGLHQRDNDRLIKTLKNLRDQGNTVVVVEHDIDTIDQADYLVDMGPGAGILGGEVTATGTPKEVSLNPSSLTGKYLSGELNIAIPRKRRQPSGFITLKGAKANNLKNLNVSFPVGVLSAVSGVSGSGKSSLVMQTLAPALQLYFRSGYAIGRNFDEIENINLIKNVVLVDQSPIGRTPRSNPATYLGIFDEIRNLYASLPESNARGYNAGRFSFNVPQGRCFECNGEGIIKVSMHFLEDVYITCKTCKGARYDQKTLEIKFKDKNIANVLDMSILEAVDFFDTFPRIKKRLDLLCEVGLDYIKLGQASPTFSGGEAQRIKLVNELAKRDKSTMYILDEPTTGLHSSDVDKLLHVLQKLVDRGNSVLVIEHNLDVLKSVDYLIDIGPEGGKTGGYIVSSGRPEDVADCKESITGKYLRDALMWD